MYEQAAGAFKKRIYPDALLALLKKEFIQMRRDKLSLGIMLFMPVMQLIIFGFAINTDVKHLKTAVFDQSLTQESRELLTGFTASEYFDIEFVEDSFDGVNYRLDSGDAKVGIIIPPDLDSNLEHNRPTPIQVLVDATDSQSAASAISAAQSIGMLKSQEARAEKSGLHGTPPNLYDVRVRAWYNQDFVTAFYMVPGLMGTILTLTMVMITSMAIVRERETGTLEQLMVTPLKTWELMLGKIIPYIFVGYVQITVALMVGLFVFDVPVRGSLLLLYVLSLFFIVASLTLGVLISSYARTQIQAMEMSFFVILPSIMLSGFVFPRESMPQIFYWLGDVLPLTYYLQILRGIFLKGNGLAFLWGQVAALLVFILLTLGLSIKKFVKKLN